MFELPLMMLDAATNSPLRARITAGLMGGLGGVITTATDEELSPAEKLLSPLAGVGLGAAAAPYIANHPQVQRVMGTRWLRPGLLTALLGGALGQAAGEMPYTVRGLVSKQDAYAQEKKGAAEVSGVEPFFMRPVSALNPANIMIEPLMAASIASKPAFNRFRVGKAPAYAENLAAAAGDLSTMDGMPLKINVGSQRVLSDLMRTWKNERVGTARKIWETLLTPVTTLSTAATRADHYNPLAHSLTVYHDSPVIMAHELGHAIDFAAMDKAKWKRKTRVFDTSSPIPDEARASLIAQALLDKIRKKVYKPRTVFQEYAGQKPTADLLESALDTYIMGDPRASGIGYVPSAKTVLKKNTPSAGKTINKVKKVQGVYSTDKEKANAVQK